MNTASPFKFLDAYDKDDEAIFFGREKETGALYEALSGVKHLLVYGPSGAGKTSLIECGLRNRFSDADWYALTIRREKNLTASVYRTINDKLYDKIPLNPETGLPEDPEIDFSKAAERLFEEYYQPVYLLFDQFEELLISGEEAEKREFFTLLDKLIRYRTPCRVLLVMREEFIGHLSEFEPLCPGIFRNRFRLEKMNREGVREVINKTLDSPLYRDQFNSPESAALADSILGKLPDKNREIELTHVQVFLSELWGRACDEQEGAASLPVLKRSLVRESDSLEGVLDSFLKDQLESLRPSFGKSAPLETLAAMITGRRTKLQLSEAELEKDLAEKEVKQEAPLPNLLKELENRRILRKIRSGEQTLFELSHDMLALVVGRNITDDMAMREKATDIYRVMEDKKGEYLSPDDLSYIETYRQYRALPPALDARARASEQHWKEEAARIDAEREKRLREAEEQAKKEASLRQEAEAEKQKAQEALVQAEEARRRATLFARGAGLLAVLAVLLAVYAYNQQGEAILAQQRADSSARLAAEQRDIAQGEKTKADEQRQLAEQKSKEAETNLDLAKREEKRTLKALEDVKKEKNATEEQRRRAEDNYAEARNATELARAEKDAADKERDKVRRALSDLEKKNGEVVRLILQNSERDILNLRYDMALEKVRSASSLGVLKSEVTKKYLEMAFWYGETGNHRLSAEILDSLSVYIKNRSVYDMVSTLPGDTVVARGLLREAMKTVDSLYFDTLYNMKYYPAMVKISGGKFMMGCSGSECGGDETLHEVIISDYRIARTETTVWQFALYCASTGLAIEESSWSDAGDNPVVNVSWYDAVEYSNWVSERRGVKVMYKIDKDIKDANNQSVFDGLKWTVEINSGVGGYRLPTESEWEYAARGGSKSKGSVYAGGDNLALVGWYGENSGGCTHPVGEKVANELGLYDMSGNVWEWCWDWYDEYKKKALENPKGAEKGDNRVFRGGGWSIAPRYCRAAYRDSGEPSGRYSFLGFRLAVSLQ